MRIEMSKRKNGIYCQWFEVLGINKHGRYCAFLIYPNQARTYAQAVRFWNKTWGNDCKAFLLRNAEPASDLLWMAC